MSRISFLISLTSFSFFSFAQKYEARIGVNQGLNAVLIGAVPCSWHPGQSTSLFASFILKPKSSPFFFSSSLAYAYHAFTSKANKFLLLSYPQSSWCMTLQAGFVVKKHLALKAGVFAQYGVPDNKYKLYLTDKSGTGTYSKGFDDLSAGYAPSLMQAGIQLGLTIGLGEKEIVAVELQLQQYGSRISEKDYYLVPAFPAGSRQLLIGRSARPTVLLAGLSFKINTERSKPYRGETLWKPWML